MKRIKNFLSVAVLLCLLVSFAVPALAAGTPSFSSADKAILYVREQMVAREKKIVFVYTVPFEQVDDIHENIYDIFYAFADKLKTGVFEPTGNGKEGDYLHSHYDGYNIGMRVSSTVDGTAYALVIDMTVSYQTTAAEEQKVDERLADIMPTLGLDGKSDYEKVRIIYDYIRSHVVYDYTHLGDSTYLLQYTAYAALLNGTSVCQGYAALFYRMALDAGLDCRIITGSANGGAHGWNIVRLGDRWYNLDVTWDSSREQCEYFLRGSRNFKGHTTSSKFLTDAFMAEYPISSEDYPIPDDASCEHNWVDGMTLRAAGCVTDGEILQTCPKCESTRTVPIPAKGHALSFVPAAEATAAAEGCLAHYQCGVCGAMFADADGTTALTAEEIILPRLPGNEPQNVALGDVDFNQKLEAADARLALRAAVGLENFAPGSAAFKAADADKNGKLEAADARLILRAAVGLEALS